MSQLLERTPRFSSVSVMMRHYREVKARTSRWAPPPVLALPSPDMMARGNVFVIPVPPPVVVAPVRSVTLSKHDIPVLNDIVPSQYGIEAKKVRRLTSDAEQFALRRSINIYLRRVARTGTHHRLLLIKQAVSAGFKIDVAALPDSSRCEGVVRVRQIAIAMASRLTESSLNEIGRAFGGRDHTTVLHARSKYAGLVHSIMVEMFDGQSCQIGDSHGR